MKRLWVVLGLALCVAASTASAATINFEGYSPVDTCQSSLSTGGLTFSNNGSICMGVWQGNPNDATEALILGFSGFAAITPTSGGTFNLQNFQMSISWYDSLPTDMVTLTEHFQGGGTGVKQLTLIQGLQTYNLNLSNLVELDISAVASGSGYWVLDNINATGSGIPEPASLLMLGSGMLGIGGLARKRMKKT